MKRIDRLAPWIAGTFVLVVVLAAIFPSAQNLERSGPDDAPSRLASQVLTASPADPARVDLATSLEPFWLGYDADGTPTAGGGYLDGALAELPPGVIAAAHDNGENRVTWQPAPGLRFATVEIADGERVIVAGQSLAPADARIDHLGWLLSAGGGASLVVLALGCLLHLRAGRDFD